MSYYLNEKTNCEIFKTPKRHDSGYSSSSFPSTKSTNNKDFKNENYKSKSTDNINDIKCNQFDFKFWICQSKSSNLSNIENYKKYNLEVISARGICELSGSNFVPIIDLSWIDTEDKKSAGRTTKSNSENKYFVEEMNTDEIKMIITYDSDECNEEMSSNSVNNVQETMYNNIQQGMHNNNQQEKSKNIQEEMFNTVQEGIYNDIKQDMYNDVQQRMYNNVQQGMYNYVQQGMYNDVQQEMYNNIEQGIPNYIFQLEDDQTMTYAIAKANRVNHVIDNERHSRRFGKEANVCNEAYLHYAETIYSGCREVFQDEDESNTMNSRETCSEKREAVIGRDNFTKIDDLNFKKSFLSLSVDSKVMEGNVARISKDYQIRKNNSTPRKQVNKFIAEVDFDHVTFRTSDICVDFECDVCVEKAGSERNEFVTISNDSNHAQIHAAIADNKNDDENEDANSECQRIIADIHSLSRQREIVDGDLTAAESNINTKKKKVPTATLR